MILRTVIPGIVKPAHGDNAHDALPLASLTPSMVRWAFIVNLPRYAGGLRFSPDAVGTDELFNVCTFRRGSLWQGLRYLAYLWLGRQNKLDDFARTLARRVRIESDRPVRYQLDGDPGGMLPLEIRILPRRLTLLVPLKRAATLGILEPAVHGVTDRA